jgi:hypothetical protein
VNLPHLPMRTRPKPSTQTRRPAPGRRGGHLPARPAASAVSPSCPEDRVREAGGPRDLALYGCSCGFQFEAAVSTSVSCPHCGTGQAW